MTNTSASRRRAKWLKITATTILVLGAGSAGLVYWLGTRSADVSNDPSMTAYSKPEMRQMEVLYGKWGDLTETLGNELKRPGVQAIIIMTISAIIAAGCFYFSRWEDEDDPAS